MTSIKPPRDDEGVVSRRLQRANTAPVGPLRRGAASAAPRPAADGGPATLPQDRGPERRRRERRQRRDPVLLDTRGTIGNRRRGRRRGTDRELPHGDNGVAPAGTLLDDDVYA